MGICVHMWGIGYKNFSFKFGVGVGGVGGYLWVYEQLEF